MKTMRMGRTLNESVVRMTASLSAVAWPGATVGHLVRPHTAHACENPAVGRHVKAQTTACMGTPTATTVPNG